MTTEQEYLVILNEVAAWPSEDRIRLVQAILNTLSASRASEQRGTPAAQVLGMACGKKPVPDDDTVRQWISEHRNEKYG